MKTNKGWKVSADGYPGPAGEKGEKPFIKSGTEAAPPAQSSLTGTRESEEASASIPFSPSFLCYRETLLFSLHFLFFTCNQHNRILPGSNFGLPMVSSSLVHQKAECIRKMCMFIFSLSGGKQLINGPI